MEAFGTNRLGQFEIKNGIANNMLLENGGSLRVEENDFAYNTTVDSGGLLEVMDGGTVTGVDKKAWKINCLNECAGSEWYKQ